MLSYKSKQKTIASTILIKKEDRKLKKMTLDYKTLGKNIKFYRKQMHVTQEQMAEQLDLSVSYVSQIERGVCSMSLDTFVDICDFLDCPASDLITQSTIPNKDNTLEFYDLYQKLPRRDQKLFYYMLKAYGEHL